MSTVGNAEASRIWVVTDGRAGNENQALGLAEATAALRASRGAATKVEVKRLALKKHAAWLPPRLWSVFGARDGGWPFSALKDGGAALRPPYPALVIGAGRRSGPIVAALRRLGGGAVRAIQILDPQLPFEAFDLVIAPAHDRLSGPRTLPTVGSLHRITPRTLAARDERLAGTPHPLVAVLIGGASRSADFTEADGERLLGALSALSQAGVGLAATASRRTPPKLRARLESEIRRLGGFFWDGAEPNPYFALLGQADALIVTADSANMASEAVASGKPVLVAPLSRLSPKLQRFHTALEASGAARPLPSAPGLADIDARAAAPLDDMRRAAEAADALLG